jgi:uncharacterized protein (TIGR00255 family)
MLTSMTGFGRSCVDAPFGRLTAEIQSVNRKHLEIAVSLPKECGRFENDIRTWVGEKIFRGHVFARLYLIPNVESVVELLPDPKSLKKLKLGWEKIAKTLGYDKGEIDLPFLIAHSPMQQKAQFLEEKDLVFIETCMKEALLSLCRMKEREGKALAIDVRKRVKFMRECLKKIESLAPESLEKMKVSLAHKLKELQMNENFEERLLREGLLFADRIDISEEITRLGSHFAQFEQTLGGGEGAIGRKMDFLIQEIGREINTIGSKAVDAKISHLVVEMKSELEKIREQAQNIE